MNPVLLLFKLALLLYSISMLLCGLTLVRPGTRVERAAWIALPLACFVHACSFMGQWYAQGASPMLSLLGAFSLYGLLCFGGALRFAVATRSIGVAFTLGAIPYATLLMALVLQFPASQLQTELPASFLSSHLFAVMASFAAFTLAASSGCLLLALEMALKEKRFGVFWESLPPLEVLDRETLRSIVIGFLLLTCGITIGTIGAPHAWGGAWFRDTRLLSTLVVWALYGGYLLARARYGWRGRKLALFSVIGFALAIVTFVLVNMGKYVF